LTVLTLFGEQFKKVGTTFLSVNFFLINKPFEAQNNILPKRKTRESKGFSFGLLKEHPFLKVAQFGLLIDPFWGTV